MIAYSIGEIVFLIFSIKPILHECSCIMELVKRVGERDKMRGFPKYFIAFSQ